MPQKKKKYNARFPSARIKKIMQTDEEVGKVAAAVPIMISRALEMFVESLLLKTMEITNARQARTLSPSHMRQCIMSESRFDFLRELVKDIPNISWPDEFSHEGPGEVPAVLPSGHPNGNVLVRSTSTAPDLGPSSIAGERPKRNYQRPVSFDAASLDRRHSQRQSEMHLIAQASSGQSEESPAGILKRKLLDPSRKSSSADGAQNLVTHFRLDPAAATLNDTPPVNVTNLLQQLQKGRAVEQTTNAVVAPLLLPTKRRKSSDSGTGGVPELPLSLLPPSVSYSAESISSPIIKIDYSQPAITGGVLSVPGSASGGDPQITPIINIDFSQLVSPTATVAITANGGNNNITTNNKINNNNNNNRKSALTLTPEVAQNIDIGGATMVGGLPAPTGTTNRLNCVSIPSIASLVPTSGPLLATAASSLDLDEDYDNI